MAMPGPRWNTGPASSGAAKGRSGSGAGHRVTEPVELVVHRLPGQSVLNQSRWPVISGTWVTAAGSSRISAPTFRRESARRGSSVRIRVVTFEVGGAGERAGVGNGNPRNVDSFRQPCRHTWHGKALAILRPAKRPGRLTLTAKASGLRPATLTLPVRHPR